MNAKSTKRMLKAGALAAGLVALLLPTGCAMQAPAPAVPAGQPAPGSAVVAPLHVVV
jgi:hypothetical protein